MTIRFNLRHGLGQGLGQGLNGDERNPVTGPLTATLTTAESLATAMGLNTGTQLPSSLYIFTEAGSPVLNKAGTPVADLDNFSAGTSPVFRSPLGAPLIYDVGLKYSASGGEAVLRCSSTAENEGSAASFAMLQIVYVYTGFDLGMLGGKKQTFGSIAAGYWLGNPTADVPAMSFADGANALVLEQDGHGTMMNPGWYGFLTTLDRVTNMATLYSSFFPAVSASAASITTISNGGIHRYSPCGVGPASTYTVCLNALWFGTAAEGFSQTNLDNIMYYLHLENY